MPTSTLLSRSERPGYRQRTTPKAGLGGWLSVVLLTLLSTTGAWAQALSGSYTINSAAPTAGTNFTSFAAAATALTTNGVSGPVTLSVQGGPYTEQMTLGAIAGVSATNRVTFNGNGRTIKFASSTSTERAVIKLDGADYVTLDSLNIDATNAGSPGTYGWGLHITNQADNNIVRGCTVTSSLTSTSSFFSGIVVSGSNTTTTSGGNNANNLLLERNTVIGGYYGITLIGTSSSTRATGNIVRNNTVRDFYYYGLYASYQADAQYLRNDINRLTRPGVSTFYGMYIYYNLGGRIEGNRLHDVATGAGGGTNTTYGIYMNYSDGTSANPLIVANNLVYNINSTGLTYAIYNYYSDYVSYYYNTVLLDEAATSGSNIRAYYQYNSTGSNLRNNIFSVTQPTSGAAYAIYVYYPAATPPTMVSNYNDLYVGTGSNSFIGYYGTSSTATTGGAATLADWRLVNNGAFDLNSVSADPQFVAPATGNLRPTAAALDGRATPITGVTTDITGAARSTTPDIGAYEFTPAANDVALESIDSPVSPVQAGARTVTVTLRNNGVSPLTSATLQYALNGAPGITQVFTFSPGIASGTTRSVSFTTQATLVSGSNSLCVTASLPNGGTDANPANNSQCTTLFTSLAGTYTINQQQPTAGTNFTSFADAATALTAAGITGSVRFNVLNGPYTDRLALGEIAGVSATDTVVFDGGANRQTLNYVGTSGDPAAVLLNGSDYVTIQNLTVDVSTGTTGIGVLLVGQATHNRIRNCVVRASEASTSSSSIALASSNSATSGTSTGGDPAYLRLENNTFSGGYYGVRLSGTSTTSRVVGMQIINNEIRDFYLYGLYLYYPEDARVIGNNVHRTTRASVSTFYGIYTYYGLNVDVENNRIHDPFTASTGSTGTLYGLYFSASDAVQGRENDVVNNLIYNLNGSGSEYIVYNSSSDFTRYYHNTIVDDNQANTGSSLSYGIYLPSAVTGVEVINNLLVFTRAGSGTRYGLYFPSSSTISSNYNDLFVAPNFNVGYSGSAQLTLANWRTATGGDANSIQVDPLFAAPATNDYHPTSVLLNGAGTPLARVPRDLDGVLRGTPPDIGAYELILVPDDVAVISIDSPTTPALPTSNPVTVTIRNGGTTLLTSVTLTYVLNNNAPVQQTFTFPAVASGADVQLTFTQGVVPPTGSNTLTVTGSRPNGNADGNPANNSQTITFVQPTPPNDEPCTAVPLINGTVTSTNMGSTTTGLPGIQLPACAPASQPKDVWFSLTPSGTSVTLTVAGNPAGMVRLYSSPSCSVGPFTQVFCGTSGSNNTAVGTVTMTGLTAGQRYYLAVSGYGSADTEGSFTISTGALSTRTGRNSAALTVFPNPSNTGQLTLRLADLKGTGTVELLNSLGQTVRQQALTTPAEQTVSTSGLATGVYTLRVQIAGQVLTRKVVLQ